MSGTAGDITGGLANVVRAVAAVEPTCTPTVPLGIHEGWSMAVYQAIPAASSHRLHDLKRSPLHCWYGMNGIEDEPTPALMLGSLVNAMLLEPELVEDQYAVAERCSATTGKGTRCNNAGKYRDGVAWFCGVHAEHGEPIRVVSQDQFSLAGSCVLSIRSHPAARALVDDRTDTEVSLVWKDEETGVLCKARPDALIRPNVLLDLKTCRDASRRGFERAVFEYGYHTQAAMYRMGLKAVGLDITDAALICVETEAPHAVAVYQFEDDVMERGEREVRRLLRLWARCMERGEWPGYADDVQLIGLPGWAKEYDDSN